MYVTKKGGFIVCFNIQEYLPSFITKKNKIIKYFCRLYTFVAPTPTVFDTVEVFEGEFNAFVRVRAWSDFCTLQYIKSIISSGHNFIDRTMLFVLLRQCTEQF